MNIIQHKNLPLTAKTQNIKNKLNFKNENDLKIHI